MTIQVLPNVFKKIGLLVLLISISIPMTAGFLNPCASNEELNLIHPYNDLFRYIFIAGVLFLLLSKKKIKAIIPTP